MLDINNAVSRAQQMNASDIHIVSGRPVKCRIDGQITTLDERVIPEQECEEIIRDKDLNIVGCDICTKQSDAWEEPECFPGKEH